MKTASKIHLQKYDPPDIEKRNNAFISLYYVLVLILLGVPMWYLTTSTYRAHLPLKEIDEFFKSKITILIKVNIICFEAIADIDEMIKFEDNFFTDLRENYSFKDRVINFKFDGYVRPASAKEWQTHNSGKSMKDLEALVIKNESDAIYVLILPKDTTLLKKEQKGLVRSKSERTVIYLKTVPWKEIRVILRPLLTNLLAPNNVLNEVHKAVSEVPKKESHSETPARLRSLLTRVRTAASYEWVFTLVVPEQRGDGVPEWDFPRLARKYLSPLQERLAGLVEVRVSSQIIYGVRLERLWLPRGGRYGREDLTHVLNGLEAYLGSGGGIHLVGYLSPEELHLDGDSDAVLVPRWGGLVIINNHINESSSGRQTQAGDQMMSSLLPPLLASMGLDTRRSPSPVPLEAVDDGPGVCPWRLRAWMRERAVENLATVAVSLHSAADLLGKVANMVIRDEVAQSVRLAVSLAREAAVAMATEEGLADGLRASQRALSAAESAFFDASLLELLYFQDDQKYGIYIPLFVPVLLPLLLAALKVRAYLPWARHSKGKQD